MQTSPYEHKEVQMYKVATIQNLIVHKTEYCYLLIISLYLSWLHKNKNRTHATITRSWLEPVLEY